MEYVSQSKNYPLEYEAKYSTHLSNFTHFPQIKSRQDDIMRRNLTEFYPQSKSLVRSYTNLAVSSKEDVRTSISIPLFKKSDRINLIRSQLRELDGLHVPEIYSTSRNSLYTRYTVKDWIKSSQNVYSNSDNSRMIAEKVRGDSLRLGRECDDLTNLSQNDSSKKMGSRIGDVDYMKRNLDNEINDIIAETNKLAFVKSVAEKAFTETENPLHISQQCIYNREKRSGIDLVHDYVEKELLKEVDVIKYCQDKISQIIKRAGDQLKLNHSIQFDLEKDARDKYNALKVDELAHNLKNSSSGIAFHKDLEFKNNCHSTPETWMKFTTRNLQQSENERNSSRKLREEIELCLSQCQNDMWKQWNEVNCALSKRLQEEIDARNKDQAHLQKLFQEIFDMEKNIEYLKKGISDKDAPLKVAQSRLQLRMDRPNMEACNDLPRNRLIQEVEEIKGSYGNLQKQLRTAETSLHNLLLNKADVEMDLSVKSNSIFIDREQCLGIRKTFSIVQPLKG